jgi:uncharacterized protein DUF4191
MAKDAKAGATAAKSGRAGKAAKPKRVKGQRFEKWKQIVAAYKITQRRDRTLPLWMALGFFGTFAVILLLLTLVGLPIYLTIPTAVLFGVLGLMIMFGRRAQKAAFSQVEGQPGAAYWVLQNMRGDWRITQGVQVTAQLDAVHRVLGRPGVVLIGEGAPQRVKPLLAQEKKRVARLAGDAPIYDVVVGRGEGEVPLAKLNTHLMKLPRNLSKEQVVALDRRLSALGAQRAPLPQGPMPGGVKMRSVQRAARRRG